MGEGQVAWTGVFFNTWACDPVVPPGLQRTAGPNLASLVIKDPEHLGVPTAAPLGAFSRLPTEAHVGCADFTTRQPQPGCRLLLMSLCI